MEKLKKKSYQCKHDIITDPNVYHQILILCKIPSTCLIHPHLGIVAYQLLKKRKSELLLYSLEKICQNQKFSVVCKNKVAKKIMSAMQKKSWLQNFSKSWTDNFQSIDAKIFIKTWIIFLALPNILILFPIMYISKFMFQI